MADSTQAPEPQEDFSPLPTMVPVVVALVLLLGFLFVFWTLPRTLYENRLVNNHGGFHGSTSTGEFKYYARPEGSYEVTEEIGTTYGIMRVFIKTPRQEIQLYDDKTDFLGMPWRFAASSGVTLLVLLLSLVLIRRLYQNQRSANKQAMLHAYIASRNDKA